MHALNTHSSARGAMHRSLSSCRHTGVLLPGPAASLTAATMGWVSLACRLVARCTRGPKNSSVTTSSGKVAAVRKLRSRRRPSSCKMLVQAWRVAESGAVLVGAVPHTYVEAVRHQFEFACQRPTRKHGLLQTCHLCPTRSPAFSGSQWAAMPNSSHMPRSACGA